MTIRWSVVILQSTAIMSDGSNPVEFGSISGPNWVQGLARIGISKRNPNDEVSSSERINDGIFLISSVAKLCLLKIKLFFAAIIKINKNKSFQILFHFNLFQWIILELDQSKPVLDQRSLMRFAQNKSRSGAPGQDSFERKPYKFQSSYDLLKLKDAN